MALVPNLSFSFLPLQIISKFDTFVSPLQNFLITKSVSHAPLPSSPLVTPKTLGSPIASLVKTSQIHTFCTVTHTHLLAFVLTCIDIFFQIFKNSSETSNQLILPFSHATD